MEDITLKYGLAIAALVMGSSISVCAFSVMKRQDQGFGPYNLRAVLLPLVVTLAVLVAIAGAADGAAVIGLLGTVAGYLFGIRETT